MKDFIEKLIERLEELKADAINEDCPAIPNSEDCEMEHSCASCYLTAAIKIVNELAEEYNQGWIPVEERLPAIEADVLLSLRNLDVYTGFRANTVGCFFVDGEGYVLFENVLAWQPLPEPYKLEEQKKIPTDHYTERFNRVM